MCVLKKGKIICICCIYFFLETTGDSSLRAPDIPPTSAAMSDSSDKQFKKVNVTLFTALMMFQMAFLNAKA